MRKLEVPSILKITNSNSETASEILAALSSLEINNPLMISGTGPTRDIASAQRAFFGKSFRDMAIDSATFSAVQLIEAESFEHRIDGIIAVGGGKVIDVGKCVSYREQFPLIAVPTQASHDGIASPISVVTDAQGLKRSIGSSMPAAIVVPIHCILSSPDTTIKAGIGDLMSNLTALEDWRLAYDAGFERLDELPAFMAKQAFQVVYGEIERHQDVSLIHSGSFVGLLIESLIMSGIAMAVAGSSRPCSGGEHLISHAIDYVFGGITSHGLQVAAATPLILDLQGRNDISESVRRTYRNLGMPASLSELGLSSDQCIQVLEIAPQMRPERYTILNCFETKQLQSYC